MVDESDQDVPQGMLDMMRMFLSASSPGQHAVLVLDSRNRIITTKYTCVENLVGTLANSNTSSVKKRNAARERRSKLRLEKFMRKKKEASPEQQIGLQGLEHQSKFAVGESRQLILELSMEGKGGNKDVKTQQDVSPIPQFDGAEIDQKVAYTFRK